MNKNQHQTRKLSARMIFAAAVIALCWLTAQAAHEAGHVVTARGTGGVVERVILPPLGFSRTDLKVNPHPAAVLIGGAVGGIAIPLCLWGLWTLCRGPAPFLWRFWAGFCLIFNGAYFGGDFSCRGPTDAGALIELGAPRWPIILFGMTAVAVGLGLWNGQSKFFGFGRDAVAVHPGTVLTVLGLLILTVIVEVMFFSP